MIPIRAGVTPARRIYVATLTMLAIALTLAAMATAAAVVLCRRRVRKAPALDGLDPLPAGLKHLATTVSDLSDCGLHLPAAQRAVLARKPRLGALLDLRHH
jgi:hypothetical protein